MEAKEFIQKRNYIPQIGIESYTDKMRRVDMMECIGTENIVQDSRHH
jgi:esterase/lipase superfamily enzyme